MINDEWCRVCVFVSVDVIKFWFWWFIALKHRELKRGLKMRDYSNVPNVFRINSSSSILLDDHQQQQHHKQQQQQHHHLHQQQQQTAPNLNKNVINEPYMNGDINYHNRYHHSATGGSVLLGGEDASGNEDRRNSYSLLDSISHIGNHTNGHLNVNSGGRGKDRLAASNCEPTTPNKSVYGSVQPQPLQPPPLSPVDTIPIASFDKRNSYMLWIVTPVAARYVCFRHTVNGTLVGIAICGNSIIYKPTIFHCMTDFW